MQRAKGRGTVGRPGDGDAGRTVRAAGGSFGWVEGKGEGEGEGQLAR